MKINASVEGVAPLLMNRYAGGDEDVKKGKAKMKKTYIPEEEAEKSCYRTSDKKLFLPSTHFKASMVKAATDFKITGKKTPILRTKMDHFWFRIFLDWTILQKRHLDKTTTDCSPLIGNLPLNPNTLK